MSELDPKEKERITAIVDEILRSNNRPNKFVELFFCRRTLAVIALISTVVAKHYGLSISEDELLSVSGGVVALILGHSLRKPNA